MASLYCSVRPSPSVVGFRLPNRNPSTTIPAIGANLSPAPLNLGFKNAARLQVRQSSFSVFASNTNPPEGKLNGTYLDHLDLEDEEKTYLDRLDLEEEEKTLLDHLDLEKEEKSSSEKKEKTDQDRPDDLTYQERLDSHQSEAGLPDAIQTGIGELNGLPVALGVLDFRFIAGTMGSVVGEKITRLTEYATREFLPLIIVCASGGARIQEGSLSLMQMGKISCALYNYQLDARRSYISILTSPTTGGVTASFGMLGKVIIAEPEATIAFAGKRVIEETLNIKVPEGVQQTEYLFTQGAFDLILPRFYLKRVLYLIYKLNQYTHTFV